MSRSCPESILQFAYVSFCDYTQPVEMAFLP